MVSAVRTRVLGGVLSAVIGMGALVPAATVAEASVPVKIVSVSGATAAVPGTEHVSAANVYYPLNGYVRFSSSGYSLKAPRGVVDRVPAAAMSRLQQYLRTVNADIRAGSLRMGSDGVVVPAASAKAGASHVTPDARWTGKHGYIETHWYGLKVKLDSYLTRKVIAGLGLGSGVAWLAAELGGGPYAGAVAAALAAAAAAIYLCQHDSGNTYLYFIDLPIYTWGCNPFG